MKYIVWLCSECEELNHTEMHKPDAHFVAMDCEFCKKQFDGCFCENGINVITKEQMMARTLGRAGGKATLGKYGKSHFSKIARKRWNKEL